MPPGVRKIVCLIYRSKARMGAKNWEGTVRRRHVLGLTSAAAAASLVPRWAWAQAQMQAGWPSANITIVVPFTPGGLTDILARSVGEKISPALGRPVIVDNRPGAGGGMGAAFLSRAAADRQTLALAPTGNRPA